MVVVSVALGFGLAQFGEARADRRLAERALASLTAEVEQNLAALEPLVPVHETWVAELSAGELPADASSGIDVFLFTRPPLPTGSAPFPILRQSAWDATLSGEAISLIDYDVTATLFEIYTAQELVRANITRLTTGALSATEFFDPADRAASARLLWLTMADILAAEQGLLRTYRDHLEVLRAGS
jgi:hypothetical protein